MRLTFLGTGTSFGVPVVGCGCETCTSSDPRDRRTRSASLLTLGDRRLLIDTPPELRLQLLAAGVGSVDGVWFTHPHADHLHGIDDLRIFTVRRERSLPAWTSSTHLPVIRDRFPYIFDPEDPPPGTSRPRVDLRALEAYREVEVLGRTFTPVPVPHGPATVFGFRVGDLGYLTDGGELPDAAARALRGVDVLVVNALWYGRSHPTHFTVDEAVEVARRVEARRCYLVHLTHRVRHAELEERLPDGVEAAYDGLTVEIGG